jgi:hypothetical protein
MRAVVSTVMKIQVPYKVDISSVCEWLLASQVRLFLGVRKLWLVEYVDLGCDMKNKYRISKLKCDGKTATTKIFKDMRRKN